MSPNLKKIESVKEMPPPRTRKEVEQFLRLVGYYCKFLLDFADTSRPLTYLTRKDVSFDWT